MILAGFPVPVDLRARSPRLRWLHQTPAGASNLHRCDVWGSTVTVTTSRGLGNTRAIAEYVIASFLHFARGFDVAADDRRRGMLDRRRYRPILVDGQTACVVGVGGIGAEVGRLAAGPRYGGGRDPSLPGGGAARRLHPRRGGRTIWRGSWPAPGSWPCAASGPRRPTG